MDGDPPQPPSTCPVLLFLRISCFLCSYVGQIWFDRVKIMSILTFFLMKNVFSHRRKKPSERSQNFSTYSRRSHPMLLTRYVPLSDTGPHLHPDICRQILSCCFNLPHLGTAPWLRKQGQSYSSWEAGRWYFQENLQFFMREDSLFLFSAHQ